jgi:hypothetical protein
MVRPKQPRKRRKSSRPEAGGGGEEARTVVNGGWGLLELRPVRMSLEDIFLQLTTEEQSGEAVQ